MKFSINRGEFLKILTDFNSILGLKTEREQINVKEWLLTELEKKETFTKKEIGKILKKLRKILEIQPQHQQPNIFKLFLYSNTLKPTLVIRC